MLSLLLPVLSHQLPAQNPLQQMDAGQTSEFHALLSNDDLRTWRNAAFRLFREERTEAALQQIQKIFDSEEDAFERRTDGLGFVGIRQSMSQLLSEAPPPIRDLYETIHGGEALAVFSKSRRDRDLLALQEVYRRWFHTKAGFESATYSAAWHLDHGNADFAAAIWERVSADPQHFSRMSDQHRLQWISARRLSGQAIPASVSEFQTPARKDLDIGGNRIPFSRGIESLSQTDEADETDWLQPLGSRLRSVGRRGSSPATSAIYSRPLHTSMLDEPQLSQRLTEHRDKHSAIGGGMLPLVIGSQLIYRDATSVKGIRLEDGNAIWNYPLQVSQQALLNELSEARDRQVDENELDRLGLCNFLANGISSDGERVFVVEGPFPNGANANDLNPDIEPAFFRLTALSLDPRNPSTTAQSVIPVWRTDDASLSVLNGMTFLGPPTPAYGKLYAIAESERVMYLLELDPPTGELLEKTPLAVVQRPLSQDQTRQHLSCIPAISRGLAVCPTWNGLLVSVDLTTKTLRWVHSQFGVAEKAGMRSRRQSHIYESEGFLTVPMIAGGRVFDLPRYSSMLQCIDLETGGVHWQVDRRDAIYVAALCGDLLLVVDRRGCRALHVGNGELVWEERVGPSGGRGILLDDRFLLPLLDGRVVSLDVRTGRQLGYPAPIENRFGAGHLIASRDFFISTTPVELSVFRQSHSELNRLLTERTGELDGTQRLLRIGELELRTGDVVSARRSFSRILTGKNGDSPESRSAEKMMRELLYIELRSNAGDATATLAELEEISSSPEDRALYLAHLAEYRMHHQEWEAAGRSALDLTSLPTEIPLCLPGDPQLQVLSYAWGSGLIERLRVSALPNLGGSGTDFSSSSETVRRPDDWPRMINQFSRLDVADRFREAYAARLIADERYQEAESLLLINRSSRDGTTAAEARRLLVELWDQRGLFEESAELLHELGTKYANVLLRDGSTGREFYREFPTERVTTAYAKRLIAPQEPIASVKLKLNPLRENPLPSGVTSSLRFRAKGSQQFVEKTGSDRALLSLVDRETGQELQQIALQEQYFPTRSLEMNRTLIPLGGPHSAAAISVLNRKVMWNDLTWQGKPVRGLLRAGPSGPDFVVYQTHQTLIVADPMTGKVRWKRNDLDARDGIFGDPMNGIIGDRVCLVVFKGEGGGYRLFDTLDGHEIREGRLPFSRSYLRLAEGRILLYGEYDHDQNLMLRIWDPLTNEHLFEDRVLPQFSQNFPYFDSGGQFWYVSSKRELKVVGIESGEVRFRIPFPGDDSTSSIHVRERFYVNLQRSVPPEPAAQSSTEVRDMLIPWTPVRGELFAYDRESGRELWHRQFPACSVISVPEYRLPFLMCLSRRLVQPQRSRSTTMSFEAVDCRSGRTLGEMSALPVDHLSRLSYEPDQSKLFLWGTRHIWEIDFGSKKVPQLQEEDGLALSLQLLH